MSLLEKDAVEAPIVKWAKTHDFIVCKVRFVEIGYPDRLFLSPRGHTIFIEMKRLGQKPDPIQYYRIRELQRRGIPAYWVDSAIEGINILKACLEPESLPETGNPIAAIASLGGVILGSRAREDVYRLSSDTHPLEKEDDPEGPNYSADETDDGDLAP